MIANLKALIFVLFGVIAEVPEAPDCDKIRADDEMSCSACNIYHEARSESHEGKIAVANVTRNRVISNRFPDTFCGVIWQRKQFSWTHDGKSDRIWNKEQWEEAYLISKLMILSQEKYGTGYFIDLTQGSLWYHADYVKPVWSKNAKPALIVGSHVFYVGLR